jgi:RecB family exonuclease
MGSAVHRALELIYKLPPTLEPRPSQATLEDWNARARELVTEAAEEMGLAGSNPSSVAARVRAEQQVLTFIARDAGSETPLVPVAEMIEASFGEREDDQKPPLEMEGFSLHGKIDRVDVGGPEGAQRALLRDYKSSRQVIAAAKLEKEGKLQLQLYSIAVRELWGVDPAGALYEPLGATADHRPRGLAHRDEEHLLAGLDMVGTDILEAEEFDAAIARAIELAAEIVDRMRSGDITRDPLEDTCPKWCEFAPICRRERMRPAPEDAEDDDDEEMAA